MDLTDQTQLHDTATVAREEGGWSEGSWSDVSASSSHSADQKPPPAVTPRGSVSEPTVVVDAEPVTGQSSDRFLRELDEAVNESQKSSEENEEAMSAFFEGGEEDQSRSRFGWRR